jgi:transcriptional regulator with XRE-family HTH domain
MARQIGVSAQHLSDMELGKRRMSEAIAKRIMGVCAK